MRKMFIYRYVIIILTFVLGGPTNSLKTMKLLGIKRKELEHSKVYFYVLKVYFQKHTQIIILYSKTDSKLQTSHGVYYRIIITYLRVGSDS